MTQTYVYGITDTVTHDVPSGLTAGQIEAAGPALSICTAQSPGRGHDRAHQRRDVQIPRLREPARGGIGQAGPTGRWPVTRWAPRWCRARSDPGVLEDLAGPCVRLADHGRRGRAADRPGAEDA